MGRKTKVLIIISCLFFLFTVTGFFILPPVMKSFLTKTLSEKLHREVAIKQIKINPYTLAIAFKGVTVKDRGTKDIFVSFDELFVNAEIISIFKGAIIIEDARIVKPYFNIVRSKDESYNFSDLMEKKPSDQAPEKKAKPLLFSINNITISNGSVDFFDGPKNVRHTIREMNVAIPFISNTKHYMNSFIQPKFSAYINEDFYSIQGETKLFAESHETFFDVSIKDLDFPRYIPYAPVKTNFILKSGAMNLDARISFIQNKEKGPSLVVTGNIGIRDIVANDLNKNQLIRIPSVDIAMKSIEPFQKIISLSQVSLQSPEITVRREQNGLLSLNSLISEQKGSPSKEVPKKAEPKPVKPEPKLKRESLFQRPYAA